MTIRAHIYIVNTFLILLLAAILGLVGGCASRGQNRYRPAPPKGVTIEAIDVGQRGHPDTWRWMKTGEDGIQQLLQEEVDLNFDGKVDVKSLYEGPQLKEVQMDLDFDGQTDFTEFYADGALLRTETSHRFSGAVDTWRFYEAGALVRIERDTNGDGKADEWMYYEEARLKRTGKDLNFDGVVDTWEE